MRETQDVEAVVAAAGAAAERFAALDREVRVRLLRTMANVLEGGRAELVPLADDESHLGGARLAGELSRTTGQLHFLADVVTDGGYLDVVIEPADPAATPPTPDLRSFQVPVGPTAVFGASNFPFAFGVPGGDTASALAVGCPVIVKCHPAHPRTGRRVFDLLTEAVEEVGLDAGILGVVEGVEAGRELVAAGGVKAVGFTGSQAGGLALARIAAGRDEPIPFYGELGSVNPVVVTPGAARARAEELGGGLAASVVLGVGQFCTKPGLVFVPAGEAGELLQRTAAQATAAAPRALMLTPGLRAAYAAGTDRIAAAARVRRLSAPAAAETDEAGAALFSVSATDLTPALTEETFGPTSIFVVYADEAELIGCLDRLGGQLTATLHAQPEEMEEVGSVVARLTRVAGRVLFGGVPTGVAVSWAMHHGGPYPASTSAAHTSVGAAAVRRWLRPVTFQDAPDAVLPPELRRAGAPLVPRRVGGRLLLGAEAP